MSLPNVLFEEFSSKINDIIQGNPAKDIEKNIKSLLSSALNKIDIVTHDKFDIQQKMVQKMAIKIAELEQRINFLESKQNTKVISRNTNKITKPKTLKAKTVSNTQTDK
ncbi:MAG: accessory factor UbiK family protein [Neisseriaceae bacterium]|nr:MAG: accessory factor UbiK family protein [Neisseriaceae bacterium]